MAYNILNIRKDTPLDKGKAIVYWLGGTGISFKFATGEVVCIDPYFSDCVEEMAGFRRLSLSPLQANELAVDLFLLSHEHPDHLDPESFDTIISANPSCKVLASVDCADFLKEKKVDYQLAAPGDVLQFGEIAVRCVSADHGQYSPGALGFLIEFAGRRLYFTGDTGLNERLLAYPIAAKPEIVIPCINGAFGNLNEKEAAILVQKCQAKLAIPCHFWLFAEHGGDPAKFKKSLEKESPQTELLLLTPGRGVEI